MTQTIVLVRHGRSAHVHRGWVDFAGFHRWRDAYEAAGIDERDVPPAALSELASASAILIASPAPRAIESAKRLAPDRDVVISPLLHELQLTPPNLRGIRMPLFFWALTFVFRWLRGAHASADELQRARDAAAWLTNIADTHERVLAVTHASFRAVLAQQLVREGWRCTPPKGRSRHWSAWQLER